MRVVTLVQKRFIQWILAVCIMLSSVSLSAQALQSVDLFFTRTVEKPTSSDRSEGEIYYQADGSLYLKVDEPVNQWMVWSKDNLLVYYPEKNNGYRYLNVRSKNLPFFDAFISHYKEDFGLSDLGFTLEGNSTRGDTLITKWEPEDKKIKKVYGKFLLGSYNNRIISAQAYNKQGGLLRESYFSDHIAFNGKYYPRTIRLISHIKGQVQTEIVHYSNIQFNVQIPQRIQDFAVPQNANIREIDL